MVKKMMDDFLWPLGALQCNTVTAGISQHSRDASRVTVYRETEINGFGRFDETWQDTARSNSIAIPR